MSVKAKHLVLIWQFSLPLSLYRHLEPLGSCLLKSVKIAKVFVDAKMRLENVKCVSMSYQYSEYQTCIKYFVQQ